MRLQVLTQTLLCSSLASHRLTAPSAVHLMTCFSPDSQHRGLSVEALSPLSPLQRFYINIALLYHKISDLSRPLCKFAKQKYPTRKGGISAFILGKRGGAGTVVPIQLLLYRLLGIVCKYCGGVPAVNDLVLIPVGIEQSLSARYNARLIC